MVKKSQHYEKINKLKLHFFLKTHLKKKEFDSKFLLSMKQSTSMASFYYASGIGRGLPNLKNWKNLCIHV
jgi:hypothetical protein